MEITSFKVKDSPFHEHKTFQIKVFLISFFVLYFGISLIDAYFLIYLPLLYLRILEIDVNLLTVIQYGVYSTVLFTPISGLIFDRFIKHSHNMVISIICPLITISFFYFTFTLGNLVVYTMFSIIYFISQALLRGCMSKIFFKVLSKIPDKNYQTKFLVVSNSSRILGFLLVGIAFNFIITNINDLPAWNLFLLIGGLLILFMLMGPILLKYTNLSEIVNNKENVKQINNSQEMKLNPLTPNFFPKNVLIPMVLIYIMGFLSSSDALFSYPFSSWILTDFGASNFRIYSAFYSFFQILTLIGYIAFHKLLTYKMQKLNNIYVSKLEKEILYNNFRKRILLLSTLGFSILYFLFTIIDFLPFMICYGLFNVLAGIYNISLVNFNIDFSRRLKNQAFFYLISGTSISLAQFLLKPLGILLTTNLSVESLIVIASILTLLSIIPLYYIKLPIH
ncbi:MAG: hypothetical protein ACFE9R_12395 [Candidatus Hermodarchaeota archaeon]